MVTIYTLTNPVTGEFYVGQTKDLKKRARDHLWMLRKGNHNHLVQKSYEDNPCEFKVSALLVVRDEDGDHYEKEVIRVYAPTLNATSDGKSGGILGENHPMKRPEVRAKNSAAKTGENNPMKRPEARAKKSAAMTGENNPAKRPEVAEKKRAAMKAYWAARRTTNA